MKKISTVQAFGNEIFKEQKLTIGLDLGDLWSFYCKMRCLRHSLSKCQSYVSCSYHNR